MLAEFVTSLDKLRDLRKLENSPFSTDGRSKGGPMPFWSLKKIQEEGKRATGLFRQAL